MLTDDDLFSQLHKKYKAFTPAEALLFYSGPQHNWKALRLILPDLNKEFTDNVYIGRDPHGLFFYNPNVPFENAVYYYTERVVNPKDNRACASIKFSKTAGSGGDVIAEFLGYDTYENVRSAEMDRYASTQQGEWKANTTNNHVGAIIRKAGQSDTVSLDASGSIGKQATIAGNEMTAYLKAASLDVAGTLFYKTLPILPNAKFVNYNNDRIVFYDNDYNGKDFNAFFFPFCQDDVAPKSLGIEQGKTVTLDSVKWIK